MQADKNKWEANKASHAPIHRVGAKGVLLFDLVPLIPKTDCFVDVFGGSGAVLFNTPIHHIEVYNDLDQNLANFFRVLQNPELFVKLEYRLKTTLYSRLEYQKAKLIVKEKDIGTEPVDWAWAYFVLSNQSFCSNLSSWGYIKKHCDRHHIAGGCASKFVRRTDQLRQYINRLQIVQIECDDAVNVLKRFDTLNTTFYCDPPYLIESRQTTTKMYEHEMTKDQHIELLDCLLTCQGAVVLSGYQSQLYSEKLKDWDIRVMRHYTSLGQHTGNVLRVASGKQNRQEVVWRNARAIELSGELSLF